MRALFSARTDALAACAGLGEKKVCCAVRSE
jgi:hypothetical protein